MIDPGKNLPEILLNRFEIGQQVTGATADLEQTLLNLPGVQRLHRLRRTDGFELPVYFRPLFDEIGNFLFRVNDGIPGQPPQSV